MLFWLAFLLLPYLIVLSLIPLERWRDWVPFGFFGGFLLEGVYQYLGINIFYLWIIRGTLLNSSGIPYLLLLAKIPLAAAFGYFFPAQGSRLIFYIPAFALLSALQHLLLSYFGYWVNIRWGFGASFFLAMTNFSLLGLYLVLRPRIKPAPGLDDGN